MTGQLSYVDSLFVVPRTSPSHGGTGSAFMNYTIDSFSESSPSLAVGRTPTRALVQPSTSIAFNYRQDEELFRDLFGSDAEQQRDSAFDNYSPLASSTMVSTKSKPLVPNKAIVWSTGATLVSPFGSPTVSSALSSSPLKSPRQSLHSSITSSAALAAATIGANATTPSLSVPAPRHNVADLVTSRPQELQSNDWKDHELAGVPEVDDEEEDDDHRDGHRSALGFKTRHRALQPASPGIALSRQSPAGVHQETLRFLEKMDLKTLLAQPRPDVTSFLPSGGIAATSVSSNQTTHVDVDGRVEDDREGTDPIHTWTTVPGATGVSASSGRKLSARKDPLAMNSSRLAHMALTYGTTATEPRKARKQTLQRLANPISGHTSTLQALSPDQRKKREAELSEWVPETTPPSTKLLSEKKTKHLIDRLSTASSVYEAAADATPPQTKRLVKAKPLDPVARSRRNQEESEQTATRKPSSLFSSKPKPTNPNGGRHQASGRLMEERKAVLKHTLAGRREGRGSQEAAGGAKTEASNAITSGGASGGLGATFLTQHEESEAKFASRGSHRLHAAQRLAPDAGHIPSRPVVPPSVRPRNASISIANPTPPSRGRSIQRSTVALSHTEAKLNGSSSRTTKAKHLTPAERPPPSLGKTVATPRAPLSTRQRTPSQRTAPSSSKRATLSSTGTTAFLLRGMPASEAVGTPLKSGGRSHSRARPVPDSLSGCKAKSAAGPRQVNGSQVDTLPQIRKPTVATSSRRAPAPTTHRRVHWVQRA